MIKDWAGQIPPDEIWATVGYAEKNGKPGATYFYMTRNMPNLFIEERLQRLRRQARIMGLIRFFHDGREAKIVPYRAPDSAIQNDEGEQNAIAIMKRVKDVAVQDLLRTLHTVSVRFAQGSGKTKVNR